MIFEQAVYGVGESLVGAGGERQAVTGGRETVALQGGGTAAQTGNRVCDVEGHNG